VWQQLADKLTIFYADREIIRNAAKQLSVMEEDIDFREERAPSFWQTIFQSTSYIPDVTIPKRQRNNFIQQNLYRQRMDRRKKLRHLHQYQ